MGKLLILGRRGSATQILYHRLAQNHSVDVVIEDTLSRWVFLRRRVERLGFWKVSGQILFMIYTRIILSPRSRNRIRSILTEGNLINRSIPDNSITFVHSINSDRARYEISQSDADYIIISGTRILSKSTLQSTNTVVLNIHTGITPAYRGVHGGYWALVNGEPELCGATLHVVDEGVDTGAIVGQKLIHPRKDDNFLIYPVLQLQAGIELLETFLAFGNNSKLTALKTGKPDVSKQYYHPTLAEYFCYKRSQGVK